MSSILNQNPDGVTSKEHGSLRRYRREMQRLRNQAEAIILSHRAVSLVGPDMAVEDLAGALGLDNHEYAAFAVRLGARRATLVCVPSRLWHLPGAMRVFIELKAAAAVLDIHVLLVPQRFVQRQPRLDNSLMIGSAAELELNPSDRMAILAALIEHGSATLLELAGLVRHHPDPVSAIFHLITVGVLEIDLDYTILPVTTVGLAAPGI